MSATLHTLPPRRRITAARTFDAARPKPRPFPAAPNAGAREIERTQLDIDAAAEIVAEQFATDGLSTAEKNALTLHVARLIAAERQALALIALVEHKTGGQK